jgi:hypothetical protein
MLNLTKIFEDLGDRIPTGRDVAIYDEKGGKLHVWHRGDSGRYRKILVKGKKEGELHNIRETDIHVIIREDGSYDFEDTSVFQIVKREYNK